MSPSEKAFYKALGNRLARLRKEQGVTQNQLAEALNVSQQTITSFEKGRRRIPVSVLAPLSKTLGVGILTLLDAEPKPSRRGPVPKLQQQLEHIRRLPKAKQKLISTLLAGFLKDQE